MNWASTIVGLTGEAATLAGVDASTISDANKLAANFTPARAPAVGSSAPKPATGASTLPGWATGLLWAGGAVLVLVVGKALIK